jgi:hypothetical protein
MLLATKSRIIVCKPPGNSTVVYKSKHTCPHIRDKNMQLESSLESELETSSTTGLDESIHQMTFHLNYEAIRILLIKCQLVIDLQRQGF